MKAGKNIRIENFELWYRVSSYRIDFSTHSNIPLHYRRNNCTRILLTKKEGRHSIFLNTHSQTKFCKPQSSDQART